MSDAFSTSNDRNPVEALADDFLRRQRGGERPTLEDYCRRHPELADEIREVFPVLIRMEDLRSDGPDDSTGGVAVHTATRLERLGDYRILREVGRGGMGVVYEAEQESLGRRVALKVLPDAALADAQQVLRFQREARAAARLHHTNIVPVFGVGSDDGHHYYVMQFIPGMGLDAVLEELRRLRKGAGSASPPARRALSHGAVSIGSEEASWGRQPPVRSPKRQGADAPRSPGTGLPEPILSAAAVAEAILTGRFSMGEGLNGTPGPGTTMAATSSAPLVGHAAVAPKPSDSSVVSLPGASADSLARSDPDRTFFRSVARIGLQVAEALEYANRQGVLHRDVKPSNLLLDPKGNVWVADFGLAKAADAEDITHSGDIIGTVRYMAPERFAGRCDARSDVYALGLTLYELLALRPAFSAADRHELIRTVMSEEPERLRGLVPHLPRDLETIVMKAIAREPSGRYASAAALAEDLQRFLDDKPIKARRVSALEQAWRWAMRNRAVASLAVGLLLALMAGLAGVSWQWRQAVANLGAAEAANRKAQTRFGLAMEAVRAFTTGASEDVMLKEKALEGLRKKLLGQSQAFYHKLRVSLEGETDRSSRLALAEALSDAASLYTKVDAPQRALDAYHQSLALRAALVKEQPGDSSAARDLGRTQLELVSWLYTLARFDEALVEIARARVVVEPLAREHPGDGGARWLAAECDSLEGAALTDTDRVLPGIAALRRARVGFEALVRDSPPYTLPTAADGPTEYHRGLVRVLHAIGYTLDDLGDFAGAQEAVREQKEVATALVSRPFAAETDRRELAQAERMIGTMLVRFGFFDEATPYLRRALTAARQLADANPTSAACRADLALGLKDLAGRYQFSGDPARARPYALEALATIRSLPTAQQDRYELVRIERNCTWILSDYFAAAGQTDEALRYARRGVALCEEAGRAHPDSPTFFESFLGASLSQLAMVELGAGHPAEAMKAAERVGDVAGTTVRAHPELHEMRGHLITSLLIRAVILLQSGRSADASRFAEQAAELLEGRRAGWPGSERFFHGAVEGFFYALGRPNAPGRPAEPPGRKEHIDRAISEARQAYRLGFRNLRAMFLLYELIGRPAAMQLLMMDQVFPANPFPAEPGPDDDEPVSGVEESKS
jgi:serine/threonine protein kinase